MSTDALRAKFEEVFLNGRDRSNVMVASQLDIGADGEYFNANTRKSFEYFQKGAASVVVELPKGGNMWNDEPVVIARADAVAAIIAAGGAVVE